LIINDPVADMLVRINNARVVYDEQVEVPFSKMKESIAQILQREGFISGYTTQNTNGHKSMVLKLKYGPDKEQVISGLKRVSKPGLRVYKGSHELPDVLGGLGIAVVSTSKGVMTNKEARKENVGGEVLCYIW